MLSICEILGQLPKMIKNIASKDQSLLLKTQRKM